MLLADYQWGEDNEEHCFSCDLEPGKTTEATTTTTTTEIALLESLNVCFFIIPTLPPSISYRLTAGNLDVLNYGHYIFMPTWPLCDRKISFIWLYKAYI